MINNELILALRAEESFEGLLRNYSTLLQSSELVPNCPNFTMLLQHQQAQIASAMWDANIAETHNCVDLNSSPGRIPVLDTIVPTRAWGISDELTVQALESNTTVGQGCPIKRSRSPVRHQSWEPAPKPPAAVSERITIDEKNVGRLQYPQPLAPFKSIPNVMQNNTPPSELQGFITATEYLNDTSQARRGVSLGIRKTAAKSAFVAPASRNYAGSHITPPELSSENLSKNAVSGHKTPSDTKSKADCSDLVGLPGYLLNETGDALLPRIANLDPKLLLCVHNEILDNGDQVSWNDIAGLEHAKQLLQEVIVWPMLRPDLFTGIRCPPRGILLFGPPGTGKTLLAKAVASQSKCTFFNISASSLVSKWIGDGEKLVRCLFAVAAIRYPSVIFIDEIDSILSLRTEGEMDAVRRLKTEFLLQLDGAATHAEERILVIGATNRPGELDEAARRRLERRLYIPLPDAVARKQMIVHLFRSAQNEVIDDPPALEEIAGLCEGYSGADIRTLCREAAMRPLRDLTQHLRLKDQPQVNLTDIREEDVRAVSMDDFRAAMKHIRATVSNDEIVAYDEWNQKFGLMC